MVQSDLFARVTAQIIAAIEAGAAEYRMPWNQTVAGAPTNAVSGRPYQGINVLILWAAAQAGGFTNSRWATYRQWQSTGAQVQKGARATIVLFWKPVDTASSREEGGERDDAGLAHRLIARAFSLFNADQVDGDSVELPPLLDPAQRIVRAEELFACIPATIRVGGGRACYAPALDEIQMPPFGSFHSAEAYYSVLGHELIHWTGAEPRLARDLPGRFGTAAYAIEELVAELGAAFLLAQLGLSSEPRDDHAAYIASWLNVMRSDSRALLAAAGAAQQACNYLLGFTPHHRPGPVEGPVP